MSAINFTAFAVSCTEKTHKKNYARIRKIIERVYGS